MIDTDAAVIALRARALTVTVCSTGSATLAVAVSGTTYTYTRLAGSFLTEGFRRGMEMTAAGFSTSGNNGQGVVKSVTATILTVDPYTVDSTTNTVTTRTMANESSAAARTVSVGLPALRAWEDVELEPAIDKPYVQDAFQVATSQLFTAPANGGQFEETGMYVLRFCAPANTGGHGLRKMADAVKALFTPYSSVTVGSDVLRVRGDFGPFVTAIDDYEGMAIAVLTIPWRARTRNTVAA